MALYRGTLGGARSWSIKPKASAQFAPSSGNACPPFDSIPEDQMNNKFKAIYHVLLEFQYGKGAINLLKGHLVLKAMRHFFNRCTTQLAASFKP